MECLVAPPTSLDSSGVAPPVAEGCCAWGAPVAAPAAWANGTVPLAAKATQPQQLTRGVPMATLTQLGPGWFVGDPGAELQVCVGGEA